MIVVTTDVQASIVIIGPDSINVMCTFLFGSQSKGCYLIFIFDKHVLERYIARQNESISAKEEIKIAGLDNLEEISALIFDWESNGSIGYLSGNTTISRNTTFGLNSG